MMTDQQFIDAVMFKPYKKPSCGPDTYDCWGLVVDYFKRVKGIEINFYDHGDVERGFMQEIEHGKWQEGSGVVMMAFKEGRPTHCGLLFGDKVLHASGTGGNGGIGQVTMHPLRFIKRVFGDIKLYDYCQA